MYPIAKVRDPKWVKEYGHTPTLMDYSRFNYVAQPTQPAAAGTRTTTTAFDDVDLDTCWPDYVVRRRN